MKYVVSDKNVFLVVIITFLISFVCVELSKKIALHVNAMDMPNERKVHKVPMPRVGGIGIFIGFLVGYMLYGTLSVQMLSILIGAFVLFFLGFLDDIKPIRARYKFLVQIMVAIIAVFYGKLYFSDITFLGIEFNFPVIINQFISMFFILGAINAINLIDGLDGLCAGISSIYFLTICIIAYVLNHLAGLDVVLCLIMLGSTLGFLVHNFPPAKTFMGDCGSTFLGFMIAVIALLGYKAATITSLVIPIVILAIPIFDTTFAIIRRLLKHQHIDTPDKEHFHHQLLKMKFSTKKTILIIYTIDILFSAVSIFYAIGDNSVAIIIYIFLMIALLFVVLKTNILFDRNKEKKY